MKRIFWWILEFLDNNWGYSTPLQRRFKVGEKCRISSFKRTETPFKAGTHVKVLENGRYDYLVSDSRGNCIVVYEFELTRN